MRVRLYFLLPDTDTARKAVNDLLLARIHDSHIHLLAKDDSRLSGLPLANILQRSDLVHGLELGLILGGFTGIVAGFVLSLMPDALLSRGGLVLTCTIAGALMGAWAAGMIGSNIRNTRLRNFDAALEKGNILLMVDVPKDKVAPTQELIAAHFPNAHAEGIEPSIPAFP